MMGMIWGKGESADGVRQEGPERTEGLIFDYVFRFEDGEERRFKVVLDPVTLAYIPPRPLEGDPWTRLEHHQCEICPLEAHRQPHCPLALAIKALTDAFRERPSYELVEVHVHTRERTYFKKAPLQRGLSSIMGILMVSGGCPLMGRLRPMVRLHLPFSSILETTIRAVSTYLLGQFFVTARGGEGDYSLKGLVDMYARVNTVNRGMAKRIGSLKGKDASVNALIVLDVFALDIPASVQEKIQELEPFFGAYFE